MADNIQLRNRGPLLTGWILILIFSNFSIMLMEAINLLTPDRGAIANSTGMSILLIITAIVTIGSGIAIWKWKRFGIYGFLGVITVLGLVLVASGLSFGRFLFIWLFNIGILLALVIPKWDQFE